MRISRIYVAQPLVLNSKIDLDKLSSHYLRNVLRLKPGIAVDLFNGEDDCDYRSVLEGAGKQFSATPREKFCNPTDSAINFEILQGLSRSDRVDWTIQKCTELGADRISIFNAEYTQAAIKPAQLAKKMAHWRSISINACEQCGRHRLPQISYYEAFRPAIQQCQLSQGKVLLHFEGQPLPAVIQQVKRPQQLCILVGPEGGLSESEIEQAFDSGFTGARLGPRVLRTETAAMTALAVAQSCIGDMAE